LTLAKSGTHDPCKQEATKRKKASNEMLALAREQASSHGGNMLTLTINGQAKQVDAADDAPLLWVIREHLQMTGTKFGCGAGLCGACTVHLDGAAVRSCQTSAKDAMGKKVVTIEGLGGGKPHPLQIAWVDEQVPQCGYCQSGQIMQAASLLAKNPDPTRQQIVEHMDGNLCRCMTYGRIQKAIIRAAANIRARSGS
jgi:isoquinoline 1-oxidoreductase alpha subunit